MSDDSKPSGSLKDGFFAKPSVFDKKKAENKEQPTVKQFDDKVDEIVDQQRKNKEKAALSVLKFKKDFDSKTLAENKSVIVKEMERSNLKELLELISSLNQDENEPEGTGSLVGMTLILTLMNSLRDRLNSIEHRLVEINKVTQNQVTY